MHVILARHGNTFDPGDQPVWVGARTDLPLVAKGREQARRIGEALRAANLVPRRTLAGPLKRTRETANLVLAAAGASTAKVEIDERLREIDYGTWEGRSSDEIDRAGSGEELRAWDEDGVWPSQAGWPFTYDEYLQRFLEMLDSLERADDDPTLIVSSNGLFKIFAKSIGDDTAKKMATGHLALLKVANGRRDVLCWNLQPGAFLNRMSRH